MNIETHNLALRSSGSCAQVENYGHLFIQIVISCGRNVGVSQAIASCIKAMPLGNVASEFFAKKMDWFLIFDAVRP